MEPNVFCRYSQYLSTKQGVFAVKPAKDAPVRYVSKKDVSEHPYIILNSNTIWWVHLDIDLTVQYDAEEIHPAFDITIFDDANLPLPIFSVLSGNSYHLAWLLSKSLPAKPSPRSFSFFHDVRRRLILHLKADGASPAVNVACKNPFYKKHKAVHFDSQAASLEDLNLDEKLPSHGTLVSVEYSRGQRNHATFRAALRHFKKQEEKVSLDDLLAFIDSFQQGQTAPPLRRAENVSIARSVIRNGRRYKTRANRNYGAMGLNKPDWATMTPAERKQEIINRKKAGANYTHALRQTNTKERIEKAIQSITSEGQRITAKAIAGRSELSAKTVGSYIKTKNGKVLWKR